MTASRFAVKLPIGTMRDLLEGRKVALEAQVADRHRQARASGTKANVRTLSAILRQVKHQLAGVGRA